MKYITQNTTSFLFGFILMALIASSALNIAFWEGKLQSPRGAYCDGFLSGSANAIQGSMPISSGKTKN